MANENKFWTVNMLVCIYYLVLIIGFGIPIWWRTTSPTLHSLPDVKNLMVHSQMIQHKVHVTVVTTNEHVMDEESRSSLREQLSSNWPKLVNADNSFSYVLDWKVRPLVSEEETIFNNTKLNLLDIDEQLGRRIDTHNVHGRIWIYLLYDGQLMGNSYTVMGHYRFIYLRHFETEEKSLAELVVETVQASIEPSQSVLESNSADPSSVIESNPAIPSMKFLIDPQIDVYINFIFEDANDGPHFVKSQDFQDILSLTDHFLSKSGIQELLDIKISSQMVYFAIDEDFVNSLSSQSSDKRKISSQNIPQLLNAIESRIVEPDNKQSHNIFVIVSKSESQELIFQDSSSSDTSLSVSVSRGDFIILNSKNNFNILFKMLMRKLIGLQTNHVSNSIRDDVFFHFWELDYILRQVSQRQILKTLSSLESVEKLVSKITNIVIQEDVSLKMDAAVKLSHSSLDDLASGRLQTAFILSSQAFKLSEESFFDPSLLSLLYFPTDQIYAVYLPLFLPVSMPLISSLNHLLKAFLHYNKR